MYCTSYGGRLKNVYVWSWQSRVAVIFFVRVVRESKYFLKPSHFHLEMSVRKPNCSNSETFANRGLSVLDGLVNFIAIFRPHV